MILGVWSEGPRPPLLVRQLPTDATLREGRNAMLAYTRRAIPTETGALMGWRAARRDHLGEQGGNYCIVTVAEDGLWLGRGPATSPPLYYSTSDGVAVASTQLARVARESHVADVGWLSAQLSFLLRPDEDRTALVGVRQVRPFEMVWIGPRGVARSGGRSPDIVERNGTPDELADALREALFAATRRAIAGRHQATVLLGGMDSSAVLAAATCAKVVPVSAVTLDLRGPGADLPHVRRLTEQLGVRCSVVAPEECRDLVLPTLVADGAPAIHPGEALELRCQHVAQEQGADVLLTGGGGDEVFGGSFGAAYANLARHGELRRAWGFTRARLPWSPNASQRVREVAGPLLRRAVPGWVRTARAMLDERKWFSWLGPTAHAEIVATRRRSRGRRMPSAWSRLDAYDAIARSTRIAQGFEERTRVAAGLHLHRADIPFDDEVVRFVCGLPPEALFDGDCYRGLLRRALRGVLPAAILAREDKAEFEVAFTTLMMPLERFGPLLELRRVGRLGLVDRAAFLEVLQPVLRAPTSHEAAFLWGHLSAALAIERFLELRGVSP